jgi:hypothetical protein
MPARSPRSAPPSRSSPPPEGRAQRELGCIFGRMVGESCQGTAGDDTARDRYTNRCLPGKMLYHSEASPMESADTVIDNTACGSPMLMRMR